MARRLLLVAGVLTSAIALLHIVIVFVGAPGYRHFGAGGLCFIARLCFRRSRSSWACATSWGFSSAGGRSGTRTKPRLLMELLDQKHADTEER